MALGGSCGAVSMKRFSPMFVGGVICTVALVGFAAVEHSEKQKIGLAPEIATPDNSEENPLEVQSFMSEGREGALRIHFSDLDLLKLADVQAIAPDCANRIPESVQELVGKIVRLRGFMKQSMVASGIPEFLFVRSTDMCCFGPKGRVDHLAKVVMAPGTTTDFIDLRPFDVQGRFRIEVREAGGLVALLYHLDDAIIIQR
jgi:hypothetical protein